MTDRAGTCTFCNRQNIRVFELDESLPPQLLLWYQPTEEIMRVMEGNMTMMKVTGFFENTLISSSSKSSSRGLRVVSDRS